jgi:hypothetical protein
MLDRDLETAAFATFFGRFGVFRPGGYGGFFTGDFGGRFVFAEAEEGGLADEVVGGPGGETDLGYEGRFYPQGTATVGCGYLFDGGFVDVEFRELGEEVALEFLGEAGAGASGVD